MVIIGFSTKTSKIFTRILCRHFKHCAIITGTHDKFVLHQFVRKNYVAKIAVSRRSLGQLESYGWFFIRLKRRRTGQFNPYATTCVNYVKDAIGLKKFWIQTPDSLYKYLQKNLT